jgi:antitoxin component YwqK of YwqJK toxin-antitoxin module
MKKITLFLSLIIGIFITQAQTLNKHKTILISKKPSYDKHGFTFANKKEAENKVVNGLRQGKWIVYWDSNQNEVIDSTQAKYCHLVVYREGKKIGMARSYFLDGNIYEEIPYNKKGDMIDGIYKVYYSNGLMLHELPMIKGVNHGIYKEYYESGQLRSETPFVNGFVCGVWKIYYESGQLKNEIPRMNDLFEGISKSYYENGQLQSEVPYVGGETINGISSYYNEDGTISSKFIWENGKIIGTSE